MQASSQTLNRAVLLDRDGVLIEDLDLMTDISQIRLIDGVPEALQRLKKAGFGLFVVSNQTVVARGLATEKDVETFNAEIDRQLKAKGSGIDQYYVCPHHPKATLPAYRVDCDCRKPKSGLILKAAKEHSLDLQRSFFVGDRITDIIAGARAGCRTILVHTGQHAAPPIETSEPLNASIKPGHECADLKAAADWILKVS